MTIEIANAIKADLGAIAKIHRTARQAAMPWLPEIHSAEEDQWFFKNIVFASETLLVARKATVILGFASFKDGWLNQLYVAPAHQRKGVGAALLAAVKSASPALQLWTFQQNHAARRFYAARGFVECERTDGQGNEEKTPDIRMDCRVGF
ncbi:MAG: GNAT family N-acetyltransferase [Rhodobacteraceae bacterium]|nr:GNAT family N-acetyltransferase [Paracoccaceae bacterium]